MALILKDRIRETTSTSGTATYELGGASTGFESFSEIGTGNTTYYCCTDGTSFEIGIGTFTDASPDTLARTTILQAKDVPNATTDVAVNWADTSAKDIFCTMPSDKLIFKDENNDAFIKSPDGAVLTLQSSDTSIELGDSLGIIHFQAPDEASGTPETNIVGKIILKDSSYNFGDAFGSNWDVVYTQFDFQTMGTFSTEGSTPNATTVSRLRVDATGIEVDGKAILTSDLETGGSIFLTGDNKFINFEGSTADYYETSLYAKDPTSDNTIYLPNKGGELLVMDENTDLSTPVPIIETTSGTQGVVKINGQGYNGFGSGSPVVSFYTYKTDADTISDNDRLAQLNFYGLNDNNDMTIFAYMYGNRETIADGNESGEFRFKLYADGNLEEKFSINKDGIKLITDNTTVTSGDSFGSLEWQAPLESSGGKAQDVTAKIEAKSFTTFTDTINRSYLEFHVHEGFGTSDSLAKVATLGEFGRLTLHDSIDTSNGANSDPHLNFERTGQDNGAELGTVHWRGDNIDYASITGQVLNSTGTTGSLHFQLSGDGSGLADALKLEPTGATVTGNLSVSADTDATTTLGRALIHSPTSDSATFSHLDKTSLSDYALLQNSSGATYINASSGQGINFNNNNSNVVSINSSGLKLNTGKSIYFEGATDDAFETFVTVTDPTADRTITLPNASGTVGELLIASGSVSDVASIDFNNTIITTDFVGYRVELRNLKSATDNTSGNVKLGINNSPTTVSNYRFTGWWAGGYAYGSNYTSGVTSSTGSTSFILNNNTYNKFGNESGENAYLNLVLPNASSTSSYKFMTACDSIMYGNYPMWQTTRMWGGILAWGDARDVPLNYFSFYLSAGNIASADYRVFGVV